MVYFLLLFLLLCLVQFLLVVSFKKPTFFSHRFKLPYKKETYQIIFIFLTLVLYFLLFTKLIEAHQQQLLPLISVAHPPVSSYYLMPSQEQNEYQELGYRESTDLQNFYFLYLGKVTTEKNLRLITLSIRKSFCKKLCIVNLYDNSEAYALDMERLTITSHRVMDDWNRAHYVFVAEHYLAYLGPLQTDFSYFPFKDWYYRSRTSQK